MAEVNSRGRAPAAAAVAALDGGKQEEFRRRLSGLGFDAVRFASVAALPAAGLREWLAAGMHADMAWMERTAEKRLNPDLVVPGARSLVLLGVNYWSHALQPAGATPPSPSAAVPIWARYALHADYHDTIKPALVAAGRLMEADYGVGVDDYRYYVDTGPVLERAWAARAGLGFVGKNAMLISRDYGNWLFLAALLTRVEFRPDEPIRKVIASEPRAAAQVGLLCGKCTRCLDACPTQAFSGPGVVDARKCISYQTIENRGIIPRALRPGIGLRLYGCDVCLEVCPWNRFAQEGRRLLLSTRYDLTALTLREILALTPVSFAEVFRKTPVKRLKLTGLLRNACVVAGNAGDAALLPQLCALAENHESPLVRAHAVWAVWRLGGGAQLEAAAARENDPRVLEEYAAERQIATGTAPRTP